MKINELIALSSAFSAEVNVERDFSYQLKENNAYLDGYLPNASSRYIMRQVFDSLSARDARKVHLITASYGTGKSYLLLILAYLLGNNDPKLFDEFRKKIQDKEPLYHDGLSRTIDEYWQSAGEYLIVIPAYGSDDFDQALLSALNRALVEKNISYQPKTYYLRAAEILEDWQSNNNPLYPRFESKTGGKSGEDYIRLLKECDGASYLSFKSIFNEIVVSEFSETQGDVYQAFSETAQNIMPLGYKGIVILHDEFGGVLYKMINKTSQTASLKIQSFLESLKNRTSNANLIFIAASHQDPSAIQEDKQQNIDKIVGRFEKHPLEIGEAESEELMGRVFLTNAPAEKSALLTDEIVGDFFDMAESFDLYETKDEAWVKHTIINALYPLHPLTAYVLPRLSAQFAQNTRSMFNFLSPKEIREGSLKNFIEETETIDPQRKLNLFTPDMLLGFFEKNLIDARSENISSLVDAYQTSAGRVNDPVVKRLMQNILVLTAARKKQVRPTFDVLLSAMDKVSQVDLRELLNTLVNDETLELNPNDQVYEFPAFGSKSLSKIIQEEKNKLGTISLSAAKEKWSEIHAPEVYLFQEHNDKYGSNRSYKTFWITSPDEIDEPLAALFKYYNWENADLQTQGCLFYLLVTDENDIEGYKIKINAYPGLEKHLVFARPKTENLFDKIKESTFDYFVFLRASQNPEVTGNASHYQRVKGEITRLRNDLNAQTRALFDPTNWLWSIATLENPAEIKGILSFDRWLNAYIEELFTIVPKVKDYALWFTRPKKEVKNALEEILTAPKDMIPLVNHNNQSADSRVIEHFFSNLQLTKELSTVNKIHYGEIKVPETSSPADIIFKLIDKQLKVGEQTPPETFVVPLLKAPFGLSPTLIKFLFTCYLRANKENLLISDVKRPAFFYDKDPATVEDLFKGAGNYRLRKIEMSNFEIKYLRQLNTLFTKETPANTFGELSKRFDGFVNFFSTLQWQLIAQDAEANTFYAEVLKPFIQKVSDTSVDREKEARYFFMNTLPGLILGIGTTAEFENDNEHIPKIIKQLRAYKELPSNRESEFRQQVILNLSDRVFKERIDGIDEIKEVIKKWFQSLSYAARSLSVFEDPQIMTWLRRLRSSDALDVSRFYLDDLAAPPIREWTNLPFQQLAYLESVQQYKLEIENYTRSPLAVYQSIARSCFSMPASECLTEAIFGDSFKAWWDGLPELNKEATFEDPLMEIFMKEVKRNTLVKDKYLRYIPQGWIDSGFRGVINDQWDLWTDMEVRTISEQYGKCIENLKNWHPPIAESALCLSIGLAFDESSISDFSALQTVLVNQWLPSLPENTRNAQWPEGGPAQLLLAAINTQELRNYFVNVLPQKLNLASFKFWDEDTLDTYKSNVEQLKSEIENYRRPLMELVLQVEKRTKRKSNSLTDFRINLKENLQGKDAYRSNAEQEEGLLIDPGAILLLEMTRKMNSDQTFADLIDALAVGFGINKDYHDWTLAEQTIFVKGFQDAYSYLAGWKYPLDTKMEDAHAKISAELELIQKEHELSSSQVLKILRDLIEEKSAIKS